MSQSLKQVFEKAKGDSVFVSQLLVDPAVACTAAGIVLNPTEVKVLGEAMGEARKYLLEKLYVTSQGLDILWNVICGVGQGGCIG